MRRYAVYVFVVLVTLALTLPASANAGSRAWVDVRHTPGPSEALRVTTSPGGDRIFVAGGPVGKWPVAVIAYRCDGTVAWRSGFAPPFPYEPIYVESMAVSSDGREVIVIAPLIGPDNDPLAVAAFDTSTGALEWSWLSTPVSGYPIGLATGPGIVVVTGYAGRRDEDWFVVALRPDVGTVMWTVRSDAPAGGAVAGSVVVRDGRVLASGYVDTSISSAARTAAYAKADGTLEWGDTFHRARDGTIVGVTRDGTGLLVQSGWRVIEYDTASGARIRDDRLDPAWKGLIRDVTTNPRGSRVFFTGNTEGSGSTNSDTVSAAYDVGTGRKLWFSRFNGGGFDEGIDVTWVPSAHPQVAVTGGSEVGGTFAWRTVAYGARGGRQRWTDLYQGPLHQQGFPRALVAGPGGTRVYVVGYTTTTQGDGFATVAYRTT
jgi:hypothetical protein